MPAIARCSKSDAYNTPATANTPKLDCDRPPTVSRQELLVRASASGSDNNFGRQWNVSQTIVRSISAKQRTGTDSHSTAVWFVAAAKTPATIRSPDGPSAGSNGRVLIILSAPAATATLRIRPAIAQPTGSSRRINAAYPASTTALLITGTIASFLSCTLAWPAAAWSGDTGSHACPAPNHALTEPGP